MCTTKQSKVFKIIKDELLIMPKCILEQNPIKSLAQNLFLKINLNIISPSPACHTNGYFLSSFSTKTMYAFLVSPFRPHAQ